VAGIRIEFRFGYEPAANSTALGLEFAQLLRRWGAINRVLVNFRFPAARCEPAAKVKERVLSFLVSFCLPGVNGRCQTMGTTTARFCPTV